MQPLLQWKSNENYTASVCICGLKYPACNAHAPYYHLWPAPHYTIFPHYLTKGKFFRKKNIIEHKMCVLSFSTNLSVMCFIIRRTERDVVENVYWSSCTVPVILVLVFVLQASACKTNTTRNQPHQISNTQRTENKTTDVVIQQHSRKLLMMDILMSETC